MPARHALRLVNHQLTRLPQTPLAACQQLALLGSFPGLSLPQVGDLDVVRPAMSRLFYLYRQRLMALRAHGWPTLAPLRTLTYWINCPPPFTHAHGRLRRCHRRRLCPACWSTYHTESAYRRLAAALYQTPTGARPRLQKNRRLFRPQAQHLDLIEVVERKRFASRLAPAGILAHERSQRTAARDSFRPFLVGSLAITVLVPLDDAWQLEHRTLALVRPGLDEDWQQRLPSDTAHARRHYYPLRTTQPLVEAVARVTAYPVQLLLGPVASVHLLLASDSPRLSSFQGCLRNGRLVAEGTKDSIIAKGICRDVAAVVAPPSEDFLATPEDQALLAAEFRRQEPSA